MRKDVKGLAVQIIGRRKWSWIFMKTCELATWLGTSGKRSSSILNMKYLFSSTILVPRLATMQTYALFFSLMKENLGQKWVVDQEFGTHPLSRSVLFLMESKEDEPEKLIPETLEH